MNRLSTDQIREQFARRRVDPAPDAEAFWSDFRARAGLMHQEQPAATPVFLPLRGWAIATACAVLLAVCGGLFLFQNGEGRESEDQMTLDVEVAHSAVLMIKDEASQSTIVWIVDMQSGNDDGGSV